jgi:hypothetical protein
MTYTYPSTGARSCLLGLFCALFLAGCTLPDIKEGHLRLIDAVNRKASEGGSNQPGGACGTLAGRGGTAAATVGPAPVIPIGGGYGSAELRYCAVSGAGSTAKANADGSIEINIPKGEK